MPQAVTHFLIAAFLVALWRDYYLKRRDKKKFPLHYVLIGGLGGLLPDIDILIYWALYYFGFSFNDIHRSFSHTLFIPIILLITALIFHKTKIKGLDNRKLKLSNVFVVIAIGIFIHLLLDFFIIGEIKPLYPFSALAFGINLINLLPNHITVFALPTLDAFILIIWIIYIELKHKITDFI